MTDNLPAMSSSNNLLPSAQEFQMFQTIAKSAKNSGLYGGDENKIFMVMLAARELGVSPLLALNGGIWNIQNKIEVSARLMNSMIRRAGHAMQITSTSKECVIKGKRKDSGEEHIETFTWEMAERAGLSNGNVWKKYPEDMLYNRCMSRLARRLFPDVIGAAYVEGEIADAKMDEKLEMAECVEIEQNHKDMMQISSLKNESMCESLITDEQEQPKAPIAYEKVNEVQLQEIMVGMGKIDEDFHNNFWKHMKNAWKIDNYADIPLASYKSVMQGIENNINKNQNKKSA